MKKISTLLLLTLFLFAANELSAQDNSSKEQQVTAKNEVQKNRRIKIDLERLPNSILVSLRDSYAKHFVTQAYKTNKTDNTYFVELRKGRTLFTVAVDQNGRVLREIRDGKLSDPNALANKN